MPQSPPQTHPKSWWREPEVALLIALVVAAYFVRIGDVSIRGEEPTRVEVALEMHARGDWLVPRVQNEFLYRPPLQNWLIAAAHAICGSWDAWVVRLPSVAAMLLATLLIYGYSRTWLSRLGALAAAVAFATLGEMFTTGCQAETEMVFIALVSASLFVWHWGEVRGWPAGRTWVSAYALVALAVLCKGPQPPVYFLGTVAAYLVLTGQWRRLFTRAHLAGILVAVALVLVWLVPVALRTNWTEARGMIINDSGDRFRAWKVSEVVRHLLTFPLEILGCTLPWSLLLLGYLSRGLRRSLGAAARPVLFNALAFGVAFVTIWIPPGGQSRYLQPLYPCLAVLIGVVVQSCTQVDVPAALRNGWRRFAVFAAGLMIAAGAAVTVAALFLSNHPRYAAWAEPRPIVALGYAAAVVLLAVLIYRRRLDRDVSGARLLVLALAGFLVLTFTGIITDVRIRRSEDQVGPMARLKEQLPPGQRLVSYGPVDTLFAYHYGRPIEEVPVPKQDRDPGTEEDVCFCFEIWPGYRPELPFAWDQMAVIPMERNRSAGQSRVCIVGRRLPKR